MIVEDEPKHAIELLIRAASAHQAQANTLLGQYYLKGNRVPINVSAASDYLRAGSNAGDMTARNNLAWVLATTYQPEIRDGEESLSLIRPLALQHDDWQHLDTLAAAHAELGNFEKAIATQERAIEKASEVVGENSDPVSAMLNRLSHYQAGEPFRE
jgi:TPR repeat protein